MWTSSLSSWSPANRQLMFAKIIHRNILHWHSWESHTKILIVLSCRWWWWHCQNICLLVLFFLILIIQYVFFGLSVFDNHWWWWWWNFFSSGHHYHRYWYEIHICSVITIMVVILNIHKGKENHLKIFCLSIFSLYRPYKFLITVYKWRKKICFAL